MRRAARARRVHRVDVGASRRQARGAARAQAPPRSSSAATEIDLDTIEARHLDGPDEHFFGSEEIERAAEALQRLKPDEVRAMWLQALGRSYAQIAAETGWSPRKVSRCVNEGRQIVPAPVSPASRRATSALAGRRSGSARWSTARRLASRARGAATAPAQLPGLPRDRARAAAAAAPHLAAVFPAGRVRGAAGAVGRRRRDAAAQSTRRSPTSCRTRPRHPRSRLQTAIDAVGSGKAAAVAASAAAVAGGGAAVVEHETRRPSTAKAVVAAPVRSPSPSRVVTRKAASAAPVATRAKREQVVRRPTQTAPQRRATGVRREFSSSTATKRRTTGEFTARRVVRTTAPAVPKPVTKPARGGAEFGF